MELKITTVTYQLKFETAGKILSDILSILVVHRYEPFYTYKSGNWLAGI